MEPYLWKAGLVAALGLTLLAPTFNALNESYVQDVQPPPWMPTPEQPPNITPPDDFELPEDFEPPEDWEGELPPGTECPPPLIEVIPESDETEAIQGPGTQDNGGFSFELPENTVFWGFGNVTGWTGRQLRITLTGPDGFDAKTWTQTGSGGGLLASPQPRAFSFEYDPRTEEDQVETQPPGEYRLAWTVEFPLDSNGEVETQFFVAYPCGGMLR